MWQRWYHRPQSSPLPSTNQSSVFCQVDQSGESITILDVLPDAAGVLSPHHGPRLLLQVQDLQARHGVRQERLWGHIPKQGGPHDGHDGVGSHGGDSEDGEDGNVNNGSRSKDGHGGVSSNGGHSEDGQDGIGSHVGDNFDGLDGVGRDGGDSEDGYDVSLVSC